MEDSKRIATDVILCQCFSPEHSIIILHDKEEKEVYLSIHLSKLPFFERFKYAIKYLFGYQSRYGAFDRILLNPDDADKIKRIYDTLYHEQK